MGATGEETSAANASTGANLVGEPVAVRRGKVSTLTQVRALIKKNMRIHMRVNACPCCACCTCWGNAIFSGCFMHCFCPIFFVFAVTAIPYILIKATSSQQTADDWLLVKVSKGEVFKQWPEWQAGLFDTSSDSCAFYGNPNIGDDTTGGPCQNTAADGIGPILNTIFTPMGMPYFDYANKICAAWPVTCHCATLAIVGPEPVATKFKEHMQAAYAEWAANKDLSHNATVDALWTLNTEVPGRMGRKVMGPKGGPAGPAGSGGRRLEKSAQAHRRLSGKFGPDAITQEDVRNFVGDAARSAERRLHGLTEMLGAGSNAEGRRLQGRRGMALECERTTPSEDLWCGVNKGHEGPIFRIFNSMDDVDKWVNSDSYGRYDAGRDEDSGMDRLCGAVMFENDALGDSKPKFTIRLNATFGAAGTNTPYDVSGSLTQVETSGGPSFDIKYLKWYYDTGFFALQHTIHDFLGIQRGKPVPAGQRDYVSPDPLFVPAPTTETRTWQFGSVVGIILGNPFILSCMFGPIVATIAFYMSRERATRQRELMRMMGLSDGALLCAWIIMFAVINLFITIIMAALFMGFFFKNSDFFVFWMILWTFTNAVTTFGMAVAAFVSSDRLAAMGAFGLFFGVSCLWFTVSEYDSKSKRAGLAILPPDGLLAAITAVWGWETAGIGLRSSNTYTDVGNYSAGLGFWMLFIDFWIYLAIYFYVDNIAWWHGVGVARKPWFLFTPAYWKEVFGMDNSVPPDGSSKVEVEAARPEAEYIEREDEAHLKQLVQNDKCVLIRGLKKSFKNASGKEICAVNNLSLTMYQDECFCLLGHNGAGKTTTMMMLTGCMPQSAGTIRVKGFDIPSQVREIRSSMGFCPQHNVLIDELTVMEHLELFGTIGGMKYADLMARGRHLLAAVALLDKLNARSSALSGGMKRKLSCALAFLAEPFLVILDEPSSGMDPFARRGMWDTLKRWRTGHILCLTTHYMDEADALGDRIAIMSHGQLACSGTSTFLKKKFGLGYVISFAKSQERGQDKEILAVVRSVAGDEAQLMSAVGKELLIQVPFSAAAKFPELFPLLDENQAKLSIESYGTSITNLEEVFLKVAKMHKAETTAVEVNDAAENVKVNEGATFWLQIYALLIRRVKFGYRNPLNCCCQIGLPVFCVFIFCMVLAVTAVNALPPLVLDSTAWNVEVSNPRVPITVGAPQGNSGLMSDVQSMWASPPEIDLVQFASINSSAYPVTAAPFNTAPTGIAAGLAEEAGFAAVMWNNQAKYTASQYGGVFYPQTSSWCPDKFLGVCSPTPGVTILGNMSAAHSFAVLHNIHASVALAQATKGTSKPISSLQVTNHPFQKTRQQKDRQVTVTGILAAIIVMAAYGFVPAGTTSYIVMEKEKDVKNQLIISGCSIPAYWISNFIFDVLWGFIPCVGAWITFAIWGITAYTKSPGIEASVALFIMFMPSMAGFAYMFSYLFNKSGVALFTSWIFNLIYGILATVVVVVLTILTGTEGTRIVVRWILRFIPIFPLGYGHLQVSVHQSQAADEGVGPLSGVGVGGALCPPREEVRGDYQKDQACTFMAGDDFVMLCVTSVIYIVLVILLDVAFNTPKIKQFFAGAPPNVQTGGSLEDEMVLAEKTRVEGVNKATQFVYVKNIHKVYRGGMHAVRGISFAADEGQVFGLLGVNGAGKTTTFKMLCGQVEPTAGEVMIQGFDMTKQAEKARRLIGYCPQFDALLDTLTTEEHMNLYGRIKGLNGAALATAVRQQTIDLDLQAYTQSRAGQLSGGNKRKLSVAMATIGEPPMVFLDEPSAGMDPVARRGMWGVIQNIADKRKKSVVILTTHSMEEAEALCSRIAIQVDGQFRCLGTAQQIKTRYGHGLELNVRLATPTPAELQDTCTKLGCRLEELMETQVAKTKVQGVYGEAAVQEMASRPGSPLGIVGGAVTGAVISEWALLVTRTQHLESFLGQHLGSEAPGEAVAMPLEKSQNVVRYQIMPAVLKGRFKSLGALFNLFQSNKAQLLLEDFQVCQPSLEQIFNRFATTQASQAAMQREMEQPPKAAPVSPTRYGASVAPQG